VRSNKLRELFPEPASVIWQDTKGVELYVPYLKTGVVAKMTQFAELRRSQRCRITLE